MASLALPAQSLMPEVQERILKNGLRVLLVERPGTGAIHAQFFLRGGSSDSGHLPPVAAEFLARSFDAPVPGVVWPELEGLLKQEEGAFESLRLTRIQRARRGGADPLGEDLELEALQQRAFTRIRGLRQQASLRDPLDNLGAVHRSAQAQADYITWEVDLPKDALAPWCRIQVDRLKHPMMAWYPLDRERMLQELEKEPESSRKSISILLGTALTGQAYAQAYDTQVSAIEALTWSDMLAYAHRGISSQRLLLVLVGDVQLSQITGDLEGTLGALTMDPDAFHRLEDFSGDLRDAPGARRLQANTLRERRLLMAWRIPSLSHPDTSLLKVVAEILGGSKSSRLIRTLVAEKHLAKSLTVKMGIPGGRQNGLMVVEALPEADHALAELEQAIQSEVMRFQQEILPQDEIRRAQRQVEAEQLMVQEDAASLAAVIGSAQCEGGNWRLAFRGLQLNRDYTSEEIRGVARRYLVPVQATTALLEPDPILNPQDRKEAHLVRVLTQLLAPRLQDPAQAEAVIRETLRQIRMLPPADQEKTQKLLEAQVKP